MRALVLSLLRNKTFPSGSGFHPDPAMVVLNPWSRNRPRFGWGKYRKTLMSCAGALYILFGILAFLGIPGGHEDHHHTFAHNITHIVLGAVLLVFTWSLHAAARQIVCFGFAFGYFVIAGIGAVAGESSMLTVIPGFIEFHAGDYGVHFATGLVFLTLGLLKRPHPTPPPRP